MLRCSSLVFCVNGLSGLTLETANSCCLETLRVLGRRDMTNCELSSSVKEAVEGHEPQLMTRWYRKFSPISMRKPPSGKHRGGLQAQHGNGSGSPRAPFAGQLDDALKLAPTSTRRWFCRTRWRLYCLDKTTHHHSVNGILEYWPYALYAIAYTTSLAAFVMTNMVWLRIWVIVSSIAYASYYFVFPAEPLWLNVITEAFLVAVNLAMLALIASSALTIRFEDTEQFLYDAEFSSLSKLDFRKILRVGEWHNAAQGFEFTREGEQVGYLYYLLKGDVEVRLRDGTVTPRAEGSVIGEVSFCTGGAATASVTALAPCLTMRWPQPALKALCGRDDGISRAVNDFVSSHMARKLTHRDVPSSIPGDE